MFYITQALKGQFLDKEFTTANDVGINFNDIRSATDFWHVQAAPLARKNHP